MPDVDPPGIGAAEIPIWGGSDSLVVSRRWLRDSAALFALPAMWVDQNPDHIAEGLLSILCGVLDLVVAYVRFDDPFGGPALVRWRPNGPRVPVELDRVLTAAPARKREAVTVSVALPSGDSTVRVTSMSPVIPGEEGLVLVGSRRTDFPTTFELHLLRVAVGQAMISVHTARRLAAERAARVSAEAALHQRNAFLGTLAQDLALPVAMLVERAHQARALATEPDNSRAFSGVAAGPAVGMSELQVGVPDPSSLPRLTRREAEVLDLLARGLSNKEIAGVIRLSERTIERHITGLYRKIGVYRRSEATAFALRNGLVDVDAHQP